MGLQARTHKSCVCNASLYVTLTMLDASSCRSRSKVKKLCARLGHQLEQTWTSSERRHAQTRFVANPTLPGCGTFDHTRVQRTSHLHGAMILFYNRERVTWHALECQPSSATSSPSGVPGWQSRLKLRHPGAHAAAGTRPEIRPRSAMTRAMVTPICAGLGVTVTPAACSASILSEALPLPPLMIAPAWPMRRPGGAVRPAVQEKGCQMQNGHLLAALCMTHYCGN